LRRAERYQFPFGQEEMNFQGASGEAMHTIDIPFLFDNIAMAEGQIGPAPAARGLPRGPNSGQGKSESAHSWHLAAA
jgi:hypothetical protein